MASSSSSFSRIGSMTPTQIGEIAKPSRPELIRLDMEKKGVVPDDNIYLNLPSTLVKDREWNLPETQEHLIHTVRYPYPGDKDKARRHIGGTNAYWDLRETNPVAGGMGEMIGTQAILNLMFKRKGEADTPGNWKAIEYRSLTNDGTSAIVILTCTDKDLVDLERKVKQKELDLMPLRQQCVQHESVQDEAKAKACRSKIVRAVRELSRMKDLLKEAKDEARASEDKKAGVVDIVLDFNPATLVSDEFVFELL